VTEAPDEFYQELSQVADSVAEQLDDSTMCVLIFRKQEHGSIVAIGYENDGDVESDLLKAFTLLAEDKGAVVKVFTTSDAAELN